MDNSLSKFLESSPLATYLERCWTGQYYNDFPMDSGIVRSGDLGGLGAQALLYLIYTALRNKPAATLGRIDALTRWLADLVGDDGYCRTADGVSDHPAYASTIGDALGTALEYGDQVGLSDAGREQAFAALRRLAENHPRLRFPEGAQGKTQQLRFELRVYYWMRRFSPDPVWRTRFETALNRGIFRYTHPAAVDGPILQPSLNADWTWNYVCGGGLTDEHATNTHTPAYYCTEQNGFVFVYLHGLRNGLLERRADFDALCRNYILGLFRNLSRYGHLASDLDGYGIHRAWFAPVLIEGIPLEAAAMAQELGMTREARRLRWYADRYLDFVRRSRGYAESGLPEAQPFGQQIGIESQFSQLAGIRFYSTIARALAEYPQLAAVEPEEMPGFGSFAWEAEWLRVSMPRYETSFAGHTSLRNIPVVPCYGDPNLGTLIGGAPLATIFSEGKLLYQAGFPAAGLWHIESEDHNGRRYISCSTSPEDGSEMVVRGGGQMLSGADFAPYDPPCNLEVEKGGELELLWRRRNRRERFEYSVHNRYDHDSIAVDWRMAGMAGHYWDRVTFVIPVPELDAEYSLDGVHFMPLAALQNEIPKFVRWRRGNATCQIEILAPPQGGTVTLENHLLPTDAGMPGGRNNGSPYAIRQLRFAVTPAVDAREWRMLCRITFP